MTGIIKKLIPSDNGFHHYVFITDGNRNVFMHRKDMLEDWDVFVEKMKTEGSIKVKFEEKSTDKGPKAIQVKFMEIE